VPRGEQHPVDVAISQAVGADRSAVARSRRARSRHDLSSEADPGPSRFVAPVGPRRPLGPERSRGAGSLQSWLT
jgi:hypothetical protein